MDTQLALVCGLVAGACFGIVATCGLYARELRRMARMLSRRLPHSAARLNIDAPLAGLNDIARSINAELEAADRERTEHAREQHRFQRDLSALSHDIRTPLTGAKGYMQLGQDETDAGARSEYLKLAAARIDCTIELLNQLFEYTKSCDPDLQLTFAPIAVAPLAEDTLLAHFPEFETRGWEPRLEVVEDGCSVQGERDALQRILDNLITNALQYGSGAPTIRIGSDGAYTHASTNGRDGDQPAATNGSDGDGTASAWGNEVILQISNPVADTQDIDPDRLFTRFWRAEASRQLPGTGLGLATAQKLARAMELELEAQIDGGTITFFLRRRTDKDTTS